MAWNYADDDVNKKTLSPTFKTSLKYISLLQRLLENNKGG